MARVTADYAPNYDADNAAFDSKLDAALNHYAPDRRRQRQLRLMTTAKVVDGHVPMSNRHVRTMSTGALTSSVVADFLRAERLSPDRRYFLVTASTDDCITRLDAPIMQIARFKEKTRKALAANGLHGFCKWSFGTRAKKLPGEAARLILGHLHGILWTEDPHFQHEATARELSATRAFSNRLGCPGFNLTTRGRSASRRGVDLDAPLVDQTERSMRQMVAYISKQSPYSKNRWWDESNQCWKVRYDEGHFTMRDAIRIAEINSRLTPQSSIFAVGEGETIVRDYRKLVRRMLPISVSAANSLEIETLDRTWAAYLPLRVHDDWIATSML